MPRNVFSRRTDLPTDRDGLSGHLPWLIAFMVYLAVMALAGMLILGGLAGHWDQGVSGTLTVQFPPAAGSADTERRTDAAIAILRALPEVAHAEPIAEDRLMSLLEPWLGTAEVTGELPLPRLIDVELKPGSDLDVADLSKRLAAVVPDASVDDHRVWLARLIRLIRSVEALATAVILLMGTATVGTVVFTTRTGLAIHQEVIEVLHLIGAQDGYIARQFAYRALVLGLRGGLIGLALALPTLLGIGYLARTMDAGVMPALVLAPTDWAAIASVPLLVTAIAMTTARLTVTRTLARML